MQCGRTALIRAALYDREDCLRLLINAGANKDATDEVRRVFVAALLYRCCLSTRSCFCTRQSSAYGNFCRVFFASWHGCVFLTIIFRVFYTSLLHGPVSYAIIATGYLSHLMCCNVLFGLCRAELRGVGYPQRGVTALTLAARYGHANCARLLLDAGADAGKQDEVCHR